MKIFLSIVLVYALLLNIVISYRMMKDDYYEVWKKVLFGIFIWLLPFIGSRVISFLLEPVTVRGWWLKHLGVTRLVTSLFFIEINYKKSFHMVDSSNGYDAAVADNGHYAQQGHCYDYGDCAGGDSGGDGGGD